MYLDFLLFFFGPFCFLTGIFHTVGVIDDKYKPCLSSLGHVIEENLKKEARNGEDSAKPEELCEN